jgi:tRNA threonylcarbamoyladenosine biosynthesis protein TsaB
MGLDTSGPTASLALVRDGAVVAEVARSATSHGAELPDAVDALLRQAGCGIRELAGIAVGLGPGSFTGLRIGLSYVKGLVMALGCAAVGVPTFDLFALAAVEGAPSAPADSLICPIVDARKGEVYSALYRVVPDGVENISEVSVAPLEFLVRQVSSDVILAGDWKTREAAALLEQRGVRAIVLNEAELNLRGRMAAALGAMRLCMGRADSPAALEPLYVRAAEATFKPASVHPVPVAKERSWSAGTKSSSGSF